MRIISGRLGGHKFDSPKGHRTHPMSDKIRGALFSVLGDVSGLTVLDAFAGSGALAFEAISKGADSALVIDLDKTAFDTIRKNVEQLSLDEKVTAHRANITTWSDNNQRQQYDLVLCDPPYDQVKIQVIYKLTRQVKPGGTLVLSWPTKLGVEELPGMNILQHKIYGNAQLTFYRKML